MGNGNDKIHKRHISAQKHVIWRLDRSNPSNGCWGITIFRFFQDGGRPPSGICGMRIKTTHKENLVVVIIVHSLSEIDQVVLIICRFSYFTILAWKCLFTPLKWGFRVIWPRKWKTVTTLFTKGSQKHVVWRIDRRNRSNSCRDITIFRFFQDGGRPPSWICGRHIWTTHDRTWWTLSLSKYA